MHTYTDRQLHPQNAHTYCLLDIEGASGHSMVPVSQLVVLRANHQPSGGLVHSAITRKKEEKNTPKERKEDLGKAE